MKQTIFIYGAPGTGKTTLASSAKSPILFLDLDKKIDKMYNLGNKIEKKEIEYWQPTKFISPQDLVTKITTLKNTNVMPEGFLEVGAKITELEEKCSYNTVVLDTLTLLNEHIKKYLSFAFNKSVLTFDCWGALYSQFLNTFESFCNIKAETLIIIAHDKMEKNDLTGEIVYRPSIDGSMRDKFAVHFSEIYYTKVFNEGGKSIYKMLVSGNEECIARTCYPLTGWQPSNLSFLYEKGGDK